MDKALRGQGCVMKRSKKQDGGAMRSMPENLKNYIKEKKKNKPQRPVHRLPKMAKGE